MFEPSYCQFKFLSSQVVNHGNVGKDKSRKAPYYEQSAHKFIDYVPFQSLLILVLVQFATYSPS